jgi:hypothetical protein
MEMHALRSTVDNSSCLNGQEPEDLQAFGLHPFRQTACPDERRNIRERPGDLPVFGDGHFEPGPEEMVFRFPERFQGIPFKGEGLKGPFQFIERQPGIKKSAEEHIPTDSGKTIQVGDFHESIRFCFRKLPSLLSGP